MNESTQADALAEALEDDAVLDIVNVLNADRGHDSEGSVGPLRVAHVLGSYRAMTDDELAEAMRSESLGADDVELACATVAEQERGDEYNAAVARRRVLHRSGSPYIDRDGGWM